VSGSVVGAEALLRWEHPEYGLVPPFKFVHVAERIGLIGDLGDWVLEAACRQMKRFRDQGLKLPRVAINVSAFQFNSSFNKRVKEVLLQADLPASMLELGLSEGILADNDPKTIESLQELKELGVYLSVDDFGTSFSPLSYLGHYQLDELRIDRSFIADCVERPESAKLVMGIISMAQSLELNIVAEGVETEAQYNFLKENGTRVMQGYLFSKAVPADELERLLVPWHFMDQIQRISS
ncbi:MAG: EAL domain-containing protein, partial [Halioglobus sp.]